MALGGNSYCYGCNTHSADSSGLCSACRLRQSNEKIHKEQMQMMRDQQNNQQPVYYSSGGETESDAVWILALIGVWVFVGTLIWSVSDTMSWRGSMFYIFWWPIKMILLSIAWIASLPFGGFETFGLSW